MWTLSAEEYLAAADAAVVPWVPLTRFDGPPEALLESCRAKIEREAPPGDQAGLKAVAQVLAQLRFPNPEVWSLLGGTAVMAEFPLIQQMRAEVLHEAILEALKARFGAVPREIRRLLRAIHKEKRLTKLNALAATCADLAEFREALLI